MIPSLLNEYYNIWRNQYLPNFLALLCYLYIQDKIQVLALDSLTVAAKRFLMQQLVAM